MAAKQVTGLDDKGDDNIPLNSIQKSFLDQGSGRGEGESSGCWNLQVTKCDFFLLQKRLGPLDSEAEG